jgi:hypothetical protein
MSGLTALRKQLARKQVDTEPCNSFGEWWPADLLTELRDNLYMRHWDH